MSDLISRQAAIEAIRKDVMGGLNYEDAIEAIRKNVMGGLNHESILKRLPSAEPEIIRCKDCKYYDPYGGVCIETSSAVCEDSFCWWGESRSYDDPSHPFAGDVMMGKKMNDLSDRQAEIVAMEKRIKDCNSDHFDYHYCSVRQNHNGKDLPSEFCRYCGACMEVDDERSD